MKHVDNTHINAPVRIHNDIASGRGDFSACMLDILFYILADYKKAERFYTVSVKNISDLTGRKWDYQQFRASTEDLGSRMFEIETDNSYLQLWLFASVEYKKGTGAFEVEISQKALPYLENLKENFTSMQLKSILMCSSKYAKRLYMLGCRWRGAGKVPKMTISDFKIMLGLKDPKGKQKEQYKLFSDFKKKVLDIAVNQINQHTDIMIAYDLTKRGRAYHWIEFYINYNAGKKLELDINEPIEIQKSVEEIKQLGFSEDQAIAIARVGIEEFRDLKDKFIRSNVHTGKSKIDEFVPYAVRIYQKRGIITRKKEA